MGRFFEAFRKDDTFNVGINGGVIECTFIREDQTAGIIEVTDRAGTYATLVTDHIAFVTNIVQERSENDGEPAQV